MARSSQRNRCNPCSHRYNALGHLFFGEVQIAGAQISSDGQYLSFLKPYKGTRNIWVKKATEPFSAARPVSAEPTRPIPGYFWSRDSKYILYVQDVGGDENFNVY